MHPMLNIAVRAARRAGSIINPAALDGSGLEVRSKRMNDFVTRVDHAAEETIIEIVRKAYPDHAVLAEESGASAGRAAEYQWISDALVGTGFPFKEVGQVDRYSRQLVTLMKNTAGIRRAGAAALDLAYVACGRLDAFWEMGLSAWDMAAGALMITEAGGLVADLQGESTYLESGEIASATPKIFPALLEALR